MSHDPSKALMGAAHYKGTVIQYDGNIEAGLVVRLKSDKTLSVLPADGEIIGLSMGKDLSNSTKRTEVCTKSEQAPILLTAAFTPVIGAQVFAHPTTGAACASSVTDAVALNATYETGALTAVKEDGTEVAAGAAYIKFGGGL